MRSGHRLIATLTIWLGFAPFAVAADQQFGDWSVGFTESGTMLYAATVNDSGELLGVGSSRVDLQACKLEYSIVSPK